MVSTAAKALRECDAVMVVEEGKPVGVLTRHDLLGFLSDGRPAANSAQADLSRPAKDQPAVIRAEKSQQTTSSAT